jgi:ElaB/YqjD/DUF883 family membrane-anchored ribosome-binding protein
MKDPERPWKIAVAAIAGLLLGTLIPWLMAT